MICISAVGIITVLLLGVNGFASSKDVNHVTVYEQEEDTVEQEEVEVALEVETSDESQSYYVEWAMYNHESQVSVEVLPTLMKEESIEKNLRTSGNLVEDEVEILNLKDYTALVRIVEAEATSEDLQGKVLIANVVLNRVKSKRFPNSIYDVVHQKLNGRAQFSPIDDGRYYSVPVTNSTEEAVALALSGTDYSEGALFFVAKSLTSESAGSWFDDHLEFVFKHGVHSFYKY